MDAQPEGRFPRRTSGRHGPLPSDCRGVSSAARRLGEPATTIAGASELTRQVGGQSRWGWIAAQRPPENRPVHGFHPGNAGRRLGHLRGENLATNATEALAAVFFAERDRDAGLRGVRLQAGIGAWYTAHVMRNIIV